MNKRPSNKLCGSSIFLKSRTQKIEENNEKKIVSMSKQLINCVSPRNARPQKPLETTKLLELKVKK